MWDNPGRGSAAWGRGEVVNPRGNFPDSVETEWYILLLVRCERLIVRADESDHGHTPYVEPFAPGPPVDDAVAVVHEDGRPRSVISTAFRNPR